MLDLKKFLVIAEPGYLRMNIRTDVAMHAVVGARRRHGGVHRQVRQALLALLAVAVVSVFSAAPIVSQTKMFKFNPAELVWQEHRDERLGYRIEMPGTPQVLVEEHPPVKETTVELSFDLINFSVTIARFPTLIIGKRAREILEERGQALRGAVGANIWRPLTIDGFVGREDMTEQHDFRAIYRNVVVGNRVITVAVAWHPTDETNAAATRFIDSFRLLSSGQ